MNLSNLPGLVKAGSNYSAIFVAAKTITLWLVAKPSISTNNWFNVFSDSSLPNLAYLFFPIASISSINIIEGELFLAYSNKSLTLEAPKPTNISTNSEPLT